MQAFLSLVTLVLVLPQGEIDLKKNFKNSKYKRFIRGEVRESALSQLSSTASVRTSSFVPFHHICCVTPYLLCFAIHLSPYMLRYTISVVFYHPSVPFHHIGCVSPSICSFSPYMFLFIISVPFHHICCVPPYLPLFTISVAFHHICPFSPYLFLFTISVVLHHNCSFSPYLLCFTISVPFHHICSLVC